ncbi:hypothetical protein Tco_0751117 [Tanacetum coccineum]|uniref:Uncharacterized protein n=1 Tax=Tanacetum coccineum TaxID=301880 RepID=A0ABQ4Z4B3_9ASTR
MEAKEKGIVLDAEAEAFLADVECTTPYDQPLDITTTNMFEVSHEDAYDSDVDEGPHAAAAFMANLSSISGTNGATTSQVNEVHTDTNQIFDNVNHMLTHEMHQEEHLDSDVESDIDDNTISYHQYQLDSEVQDVSTEEQSLVNDSLRAELARCKLEMVSLDRNKVKHDLDQTIVQPTHDLHKKALGRSNLWNLKQAKLSQPTLYDGHALLNPTHTSIKVHDSEDSLVHAEVSRTKMSERLGTIKPINYAELNALYSYFVPQKELSREQVYWLPTEELATQKSNLPKPVTPFVRTRLEKSQISTCLQGLNSLIPAFTHGIHQRTDPCRYPSGSAEFKPIKAMFTEQIIPFYEKFKQLVQKLNENIVIEVTKYMQKFDVLDTEYERCVLANKNLKIERKNLLIQNDCLIANCLEKDICSIVLTSDIVVPPSSNCLCEELRSNCDREHSKVVELEAEILKKQQMLNESEKCCAFIEKNHVNLQVKFQKYKECLQNQRVCDNTNSTASNAIFEINKLKDQLQGKDDTIRNLQTQINITRMLNVGSTVASEKPKVLASGMYTNRSQTFPPPKKPTGETNPLLRKSTTKPATESRKPIPKSHTRNHHILPSKSVNERRAADHNRRLNVVDHNQFVIHSLKSVNTKTPQAKHSVNHTKKVWKATRNHNVNTIKIAWRPTGKVVGSVKPQWKPTG